MNKLTHFTSKAYIVTYTAWGMHDQYGATTVLIGVFNTQKRAELAKERYAKANKITNQRKIDGIKINEFKPNSDCEIFLSKVYE